MKITLYFFTAILLLGFALHATPKPNIILIMADDQGWGQVSYNGHPVLKTPNLDSMANNGLRMNRFYAAAPVCSPTRASVLTGRTPFRAGVPVHGWNLCLQEKTLPQALQKAGYATALFGKWHLNGLRGPGVPILASDPNHPGHYGFDEWLSVTNFFDLDPILSREGDFEEFEGDSSVIVVEEALDFMAREAEAQKPFLAVIWYGSPHNPVRFEEQDRVGLPEGKVGDHLAEIVGIDRSIGVLRKGLRELGIENNTLIWYCSDNGGLGIDPDAMGILRGKKSNIYEGGIRVPGIIEWPGHIDPMVTDFPASTMDIFPTFVDLLNLPKNSQLELVDGESIVPLFRGEAPERSHGIPFRFHSGAALIDGDYKLLCPNVDKPDQWVLYNLRSDPSEKKDVSKDYPERFAAMKKEMEDYILSINASVLGADYSEGKVLQEPRRGFWTESKDYQPYFETLLKRPEYIGQAKRANKFIASETE